MDAQDFEKMYPTTADKASLVVSAVLPFVLFVGSVRSALKGDYTKATYKAVLWSGMTRNFNESLRWRYEKVRRTTKRDMGLEHLS